MGQEFSLGIALALELMGNHAPRGSDFGSIIKRK